MRSNVNDKGILRNIFRSDVVVTSQEEDNFGWFLSSFKVQSQLKSINIADASVEDIVTIPSLLSVDEFICVRDLSGAV